MMTLFWFLAGFAVCLGVARYNEDDSLFWKLFISFVGAFTAATVVKTQLENENREKVVKIEKVTTSPTQVLQSTPSTINFYSLADVSQAATKREKSPKPVSKDSLINQNDSSLSKVFGSIRGQPQMFAYFDTS
jgi:hypothetical protein